MGPLVPSLRRFLPQGADQGETIHRVPRRIKSHMGLATLASPKMRVYDIASRHTEI